MKFGNNFPIGSFIRTLLLLSGIGVCAILVALGFGIVWIVQHVRFQ